MTPRAGKHHLVLTSNGSDGACAAAMVLVKHPKADLINTSAGRVAQTLQHVLGMAPLPRAVHVCGVGAEESLEAIVESLRDLRRGGTAVIWYCGRGYLDPLAPRLQPVCETAFLDAKTNTEAVRRRLDLPHSGRNAWLVKLAEQFVDPALKRSKDDQFHHDLINAAAGRYFKYEDAGAFAEAVRALAGLAEISDAGRNMVEAYRNGGRRVPLGNSAHMKRFRQAVRRLAPLSEPVLILGPTGSGKEIAARLLHESGGRPGPFVAVNCAVLGTSNELAHDHLFGHEAGAYTGSRGPRQGAFETANRGVLFLDEVAELPVGVQTQLLRALEEGVVTPLGSSAPRRVDVRVIAATNQNLPEMIAAGRFRMDLYHRINVLVLRTVALRDRPEDMKSIARSVLYDLRKKGFDLKLAERDWEILLAYPWPGNIRQFTNILKRAALMNVPVAEALEEEKVLCAAGGPGEPDLFHPADADGARPLDEIRAAYARRVFDLCGGNWTRAAAVLGVSKNTLKNLLRP